MPITTGIHHITAIAASPQDNINFYSKILGLQLVKITVNYDDPQTYHLYYGTANGAPGSILTFFPWPGASSGKAGLGQVTAIALATRPGGLRFWKDRLDHLLPGSNPKTFERFGANGIAFSDPAGLTIEIVESGIHAFAGGASHGDVPFEVALTHIHSATLSVSSLAETSEFIHQSLGFENFEREANRLRLIASASSLDVENGAHKYRGSTSAGTVHHIAFRASTEKEQLAWQQELTDRNFNVTPVMDRTYFKSIYFREPGGVLVEIATDEPGFAVNEPIDSLGHSLQLPLWLEASREDIERMLPQIEVHGTFIGQRR